MACRYGMAKRHQAIVYCCSLACDRPAVYVVTIGKHTMKAIIGMILYNYVYLRFLRLFFNSHLASARASCNIYSGANTLKAVKNVHGVISGYMSSRVQLIWLAMRRS